MCDERVEYPVHVPCVHDLHKSAPIVSLHRSDAYAHPVWPSCTLCGGPISPILADKAANPSNPSNLEALAVFQLQTKSHRAQ